MRLSNTEMTISILRMPCDAFKWGRKGCASRHCSGNAGPLLAEVGGWQSPKRFGGSLEAAASCLSALSIQSAKAARRSQDELPRRILHQGLGRNRHRFRVCSRARSR